MEYNFYVDDAKKINIQRICDEAPQDQNIILVNKKILLVRESFLHRFLGSDKIELLDENLCRSWGFPGLTNVFSEKNKAIFQPSPLINPTLIKGFRVGFVKNKSIEQIKNQIKKAMNFQRKINVKVKYL